MGKANSKFIKLLQINVLGVVGHLRGEFGRQKQYVYLPFIIFTVGEFDNISHFVIQSVSEVSERLSG